MIDLPLQESIDDDFPRPTPLPIRMSAPSDDFIEDSAVEVVRSGEGNEMGEIHVGTTRGLDIPLPLDSDRPSPDQNQSDFPSPVALSPSSAEYFVRRETKERRKRKRTYSMDRDPLGKPLQFFDLVDDSTTRFRRSPSPSMEIDVSTDSIEVSDQPLFEEPKREEDVLQDHFYIDNQSGEVCMSTLSFSMLLLSILLIFAILSLIYWIHAFRRTGTSGSLLFSS
ncbi:hypothetical protein PMAYCL1PPCAC_29838 [Pristionchus mayeri]|uniref:Uncharacterized protein n=1 Tax=Pristionchus mayeri TaxID=1317129 RepID=A0AAN5DA06_9BILA|nr:hypothetical protein PMAYCL1PPCAC_29838 [Pristionchus mayeri]